MGNKRVPREVISQIRTAMVMQFPNCFSAKGQPKKPLKIRIDRDIFEDGRAAYPELSRKLISAFLRDYTGGQNYHRCMVEGAERVGLFGAPCGVVSAADAAFHAKQLDWTNARKPKPDAEHINKINRLRARLETLREAARDSEISNGRYYTDGSKRRDDAQILAVERELRELEERAE